MAARSNFSETDDCGSSLTAGTSCNINVTFTPTAIDNLAGTLTITDKASGCPKNAAQEKAGRSGRDAKKTQAGLPAGRG
jgi:hypothetical protein